MQTHKRYKTRASVSNTLNSTPRSSIRSYFRDSQRSSPGAIVSAPRAHNSTEAVLQSTPASPPTTSARYSEVTGDVHSDMATHPRQVRDLPDDLRAILQALPTKADFEALPSKTDIETLIQRVEEAHARDIQEIREEMQTISERVDAGESSISALTQRVKDLEQSRETQAATAVDLQLHLEDLEDRSRRNNLRLRGIPEATGAEDLEATVLAILQGVLDTPQTSIELDRVHRTLGPRPSDPDRPRDVLCRVHRYTQKDLVLRKAWERGEVMFDGAEIKILPDLSRATLQRRAMLKPILELARGLGCTYR